MRVITNADDLGCGPLTDQATFELIAEGLVTSTTVLANGPTAADAPGWAREFPNCSFGVHLNLTDFKPFCASRAPQELLGEGGRFRSNLRLVPRLKRFREFIFYEFCAQIEYLLSQGMKLSHLDSHHHIHTIPVLLPVLKAVQRKYGIRKVRISRNVYLKASPASKILLLKKMIFNAVLRHWFSTRTTEAFTDLPAFCEGTSQFARKYHTIEIELHPGARTCAGESDQLRFLDRKDPEFRASLISYENL